MLQKSTNSLYRKFRRFRRITVVDESGTASAENVQEEARHDYGPGLKSSAQRREDKAAQEYEKRRHTDDKLDHGII